jgi:hypothetical protein
LVRHDARLDRRGTVKRVRTRPGFPTEDAQVLEKAFQARLAAIGVDAVKPSNAEAWNVAAPTPLEPNTMAAKPKRRRRYRAIDKSVLAVPELRRVRDRDHVKSVAQHPCLICGRRPSDAHHLRFAQSKALGRKVGDEFTVPLCRGHQREVHRCGDETQWWRNAGIDPAMAARSLWLENPPAAEWSGRSLLEPATTDGAPIDGAAKSLAYLEQRRTLNNGSRRPEHHWRVRWRRPSAAAAML